MTPRQITIYNWSTRRHRRYHARTAGSGQVHLGSVWAQHDVGLRPGARLLECDSADACRVQPPLSPGPRRLPGRRVHTHTTRANVLELVKAPGTVAERLAGGLYRTFDINDEKLLAIFDDEPVQKTD